MPQRHRVAAGPVVGQHDLKPAVAVLQLGEEQSAEVANRADSAGHGHLLAGVGVRGEAGVLAHTAASDVVRVTPTG